MSSDAYAANQRERKARRACRHGFYTSFAAWVGFAIIAAVYFLGGQSPLWLILVIPTFCLSGTLLAIGSINAWSGLRDLPPEFRTEKLLAWVALIPTLPLSFHFILKPKDVENPDKARKLCRQGFYWTSAAWAVSLILLLDLFLGAKLLPWDNRGALIWILIQPLFIIGAHTAAWGVRHLPPNEFPKERTLANISTTSFQIEVSSLLLLAHIN